MPLQRFRAIKNPFAFFLLQCRPLELWLDARGVGQDGDGASGDWEDFQESADAIVLCEDNSSLESAVKRQDINARPSCNLAGILRTYVCRAVSISP